MNVFVMRHGETAWSVSGRHTSTTDLPLTDNGRRLAEKVTARAGNRSVCARFRQPNAARARDLSELAGLGNAAVIDPDWPNGTTANTRG